MSAHTPGPWKVTDTDWMKGYRIQAVVSGPNGDIAQVTNVPDARLIAAAPRMLALIKLLLNDPGHVDIDRETRAILRDVEGSKNHG